MCILLRCVLLMMGRIGGLRVLLRGRGGGRRRGRGFLDLELGVLVVLGDWSLLDKARGLYNSC